MYIAPVFPTYFFAFFTVLVSNTLRYFLPIFNLLYDLLNFYLKINHCFHAIISLLMIIKLKHGRSLVVRLSYLLRYVMLGVRAHFHEMDVLYTCSSDHSN